MSLKLSSVLERLRWPFCRRAAVGSTSAYQNGASGMVSLGYCYTADVVNDQNLFFSSRLFRELPGFVASVKFSGCQSSYDPDSSRG